MVVVLETFGDLIPSVVVRVVSCTIIGRDRLRPLAGFTIAVVVFVTVRGAARSGATVPPRLPSLDIIPNLEVVPDQTPRGTAPTCNGLFSAAARAPASKPSPVESFIELSSIGKGEEGGGVGVPEGSIPTAR